MCGGCCSTNTRHGQTSPGTTNGRTRHGSAARPTGSYQHDPRAPSGTRHARQSTTAGGFKTGRCGEREWVRRRRPTHTINGTNRVTPQFVFILPTNCVIFLLPPRLCCFFFLSLRPCLRPIELTPFFFCSIVPFSASIKQTTQRKPWRSSTWSTW